MKIRVGDYITWVNALDETIKGKGRVISKSKNDLGCQTIVILNDKDKIVFLELGHTLIKIINV